MKVSVCLISYNGEKYIKRQLTSILNQTYSVDEIIISDNSSTDRTVEIIRSLEDDRIKLYDYVDTENNPRIRIIKNAEFALKQAKGEFIFLADQDDIWFVNKVEIMMKYLEKSTLVSSDLKLIDENENIIAESYFKLRKIKFDFPFDFIRSPYAGCAIAFRRELLQLALPFPKSIPMHDLWLGSVAKYYFSIDIIEKPLMYYRRHDGNASTSGKKSKYSLPQKIKFRYYLLLELINVMRRVTR